MSRRNWADSLKVLAGLTALYVVMRLLGEL
jgi:hypothetical protein